MEECENCGGNTALLRQHPAHSNIEILLCKTCYEEMVAYYDIAIRDFGKRLQVE